MIDNDASLSDAHRLMMMRPQMMTMDCLAVKTTKKILHLLRGGIEPPLHRPQRCVLPLHHRGASGGGGPHCCIISQDSPLTVSVVMAACLPDFEWSAEHFPLPVCGKSLDWRGPAPTLHLIVVGFCVVCGWFFRFPSLDAAASFFFVPFCCCPVQVVQSVFFSPTARWNN